MRVAKEWRAYEGPLAFLLAIMRDETQPLAVRLDCAKAALPYCSPPLAAVHVRQDGGQMSHAEWLRYLSEDESASAA